jgi:predicted nucleic acid-binding protein
MRVRVFIDSTTFLHTVDRFETEKALQAQDWLGKLTLKNCGQTNLQVLNEVANVLIRKRSRFEGIDPFWQVDAFSAFGMSPVTPAIVMVARTIHLQTGYSWWDCVLLASALDLDCTHFLSEDLQDGHRITGSGGKGLTVVDPFAHSPGRFLSEQD